MIGWCNRRTLAAILLIVGAGMLQGCVYAPYPGAYGPYPAYGGYPYPAYGDYGSPVVVEGGWGGGYYGGGGGGGGYRGGGWGGGYQGGNWGGGYRGGH